MSCLILLNYLTASYPNATLTSMRPWSHSEFRSAQYEKANETFGRVEDNRLSSNRENGREAFGLSRSSL